MSDPIRVSVCLYWWEIESPPAAACTSSDPEHSECGEFLLVPVSGETR